jgi:hypothetical protein
MTGSDGRGAFRLQRFPPSKIPRDRAGRPLMIAMWGAKVGPFAFVVSEHLSGFRATYSHEADRRPVFIGPFATLAEAEAVCAATWLTLASQNLELPV